MFRDFSSKMSAAENRKSVLLFHFILFVHPRESMCLHGKCSYVPIVCNVYLSFRCHEFLSSLPSHRQCRMCAYVVIGMSSSSHRYLNFANMIQLLEPKLSKIARFPLGTEIVEACLRVKNEEWKIIRSHLLTLRLSQYAFGKAPLHKRQFPDAPAYVHSIEYTSFFLFFVSLSKNTFKYVHRSGE